MKKLWGSRFNKSTDKLVNEFNSSLHFDQKLYKYDILGSIAHAKMLGNQGIISEEEVQKITKGLEQILSEAEKGQIEFNAELEDIHTNIEKLLIEKIGETGKKVHTGRSRNDQVALDVRMYLKEEIKNIQKLLIELEKELLTKQKEHLETIMPGYTHLQRAQPITFSHHLGAYAEMFKRDFERLKDSYKRVNILPLGSGALATTSHNLDRMKTAEYLGFDDICLNSLDAVSDRDFVIETISAISIIMMHLSRFCEEIILWASLEFGFVEIDDGFSTGSSLMPQKKNPDVAELIRGKTGRVYGDLFSILTVMKSLPLAYNKDMQEDKEPLFDAIETVKACLKLITPMLSSMKINKNKMLKAIDDGFLNATDVADYLVNQGVPFRDAHENVGKLVVYCIKNSKNLNTLSLEEYKSVNALFESDIFEAITPKTCVNSRKIIGGPSSEAMKKVISVSEDWIKSNEKQN